MIDIIPNIKKYTKTNEYCSVEKIKWEFSDGTDERVKRAAQELAVSASDGISIVIKHGADYSEAYTINIESDKVEIASDGAAGAFYAIMTLKQLLKANAGKLQCGKLADYPDMAYRGFYQDTTRGRVPTLATLKKLADTMADNKLNSLQLYVEHSFEFDEYDFCRDELGYLTKAEVEELDAYCKERFIELIPSLATFGHLYHLLQSDKYKHLCELKDYTPTQHHFVERMVHHTINPLSDESFELIRGLIDSHMSAFTSNCFNICGDETFDLGTDVNKGKDKGELYIGFIKKIIAYLQSMNKTVMMWGDIVLKYPERLSELPDDVIFLNWSYQNEPDENKIKTLKDKRQIVCPGTSSWSGFSERPSIEEDNITRLGEYGYKYNAIGMLNTNWGDIGNLASIDMATYGLILGAMVSWSRDFKLNAETKKAVSLYYYGDSRILDTFDALKSISDISNTGHIFRSYEERLKKTESEYTEAVNKCIAAAESVKAMSFAEETMRQEFVLAFEGYALAIKWLAKRYGYSVECSVDFDRWMNEYKTAWLTNSKVSELNEIIRVFTDSEKSTI